jgi:hypothetical protein
MTRKPKPKPAAQTPRPPAEGGSYVRDADGSLTKASAQPAATEAAPAKDED